MITITRSDFIQEQMANLKVLAELLANEADRLPKSGGMPGMLCRDSMMTIQLLVPKLEATCKILLEHGSQSSGQSNAGKAAR